MRVVLDTNVWISAQMFGPDNRVLECALAAQADAIVTGDKAHLLPLQSFRTIPILTPAEFLRRYQTKI